MRDIGRRRRLESPSIVASTWPPATTPDKSRIVVPLLPQSRTSVGGRSDPPVPRTVAEPTFISMSTPSRTRQPAVERTFCRGARFSTWQVPFDSAARISARWDIDLSPGALVRPLKCRARTTRTRIARQVSCPTKKPLAQKRSELRGPGPKGEFQPGSPKARPVFRGYLATARVAGAGGPRGRRHRQRTRENRRVE